MTILKPYRDYSRYGINLLINIMKLWKYLRTLILNKNNMLTIIGWILFIGFLIFMLSLCISLIIEIIPGLKDFLKFYFENFFENLENRVKEKRELIDDEIKKQVKEEFEEFFSQLEKTEITRQFLKEQTEKLKNFKT